MSSALSGLPGPNNGFLSPAHALALSQCKRNDLVLCQRVKAGTSEMHRIIGVYNQLVVAQDAQHSNWPKAGCWSLTGNDCSYIEDGNNLPCPQERLPYCLDAVMKPGDILHIRPSGRLVRRLLFNSKCPLNSCSGGFTCLGSRNVLSGFTQLQSNLGSGCKLPMVCCPVCFGYDFAIKDRERMEEISKYTPVPEPIQPPPAKYFSIRQRAPANMRLAEGKKPKVGKYKEVKEAKEEKPKEKSKEEEERDQEIFLRQELIRERASELGLAAPKFEENSSERRWHIIYCTIYDKPIKKC